MVNIGGGALVCSTTSLCHTRSRMGWGRTYCCRYRAETSRNSSATVLYIDRLGGAAVHAANIRLTHLDLTCNRRCPGRFERGRVCSLCQASCTPLSAAAASEALICEAPSPHTYARRQIEYRTPKFYSESCFSKFLRRSLLSEQQYMILVHR